MPLLDMANQWMNTILTLAAVITMVVTVNKTIQKPNHTQDERLDELESWREKVDTRLEEGNQHFNDIDEGNKVTQKSLLAIMSHEINGNDIDKLKTARDELENYLTEK